MNKTLDPNRFDAAISDAKAKVKEKSIQEYFIFEMRQLLKKYNAELMVESPDGPLNECDGHITVIIHSTWNEGVRLSGTQSFSLGGRV